ncbi:hypothetical protein BCR42DRAFT_423743 [Absidia repens]|uniref:Uncharacterized protein n=1 Tax=Absidia repens TaxID=90262 RepID=A0A1X2I5A1_9FUNG|nr:hypothetical protein BCR42DRAFT_423743 [Absidia repens]
MNLSAGVAQQTTTTIPHQPEKACYNNNGVDAIDQSSDTASSNGASPITPYEQKPFTFSDYGNKTKSGDALDNKTMEPSPHTDDATLDIQSYTYQQPVQQKQNAQQPVAQPLENDVDTPSPNQSNMPEIVTAGNSNGDSIIPKMPWDNNHNDHTAATADNTSENQDKTLLIYGADEKYDMESIGNSSCSIACLDFPSPPSSTPSLVPKLTIQTDRTRPPESAETPDMESHLTTDHHQLNQHTEAEQPHESSSNQSPRSDNKLGSLSRFKEIFDIEGTDIEWDYHAKYCQQPPVTTIKSYSSPLAPLPEKSVSSFTSPISPTPSNKDGHLFLDKQQNRQHLLSQTDTSSLRSNTNTNANVNKTIGGFITNIGRSTSSSSSSTTSTTRTKPDGPIRSLSSSSSSSSLRGLMRSLSTTATNHYRQQTPKMTPHMNEEDGLSRAAQAVAATTTNDNDKLYLCREEIISEPSKADLTNSLDGQRRKISQLFSTAIKKAPSRRHTTKVVNMQQEAQSSSSKKLLRRTVIYVNPENEASHHDFYADLLKQYQPHRPAPTPPSPIQRYRYDKTLPPVPSTIEPTSSSTQSSPRSSASSHLSSSSTSSTSNTNKPKPSYLEGLELREMEDGSMEWGIIKKEGHRQSFFSMAHLQQNEEEEGQLHLTDTAHSTMEDGSEEHIEQQVLALMGLEPDHLEKQPLHRPPPIPRRSPRRKPSTLLPSTSSRNSSSNRNNKHQNKDDSLLQHTIAGAKDDSEDESSPSSSTMNVYYAPDMTLPSLLHLVSQTQQNNNSSINNVV